MVLLRIGKPPEVRDLEAMLREYESSDAATRLTIVERCERTKWSPSGPLLRAFAFEVREEIALRILEVLAHARPAPTRRDLIPLLDVASRNGLRRLALRLSDAIRKLPENERIGSS